ncbi:WD40 repeat domain-containing protein [Agrobacterium tumefaciens]|uniref:WD40 repeat domain-containing protein n=1 Tax=Agrobacterium tumefaciens TaxID=358 RepID=UPI000EF19435|nr:WD40 repeat domain-containing protein [Agrobacterium tumefaciens]AYM08965.1 hypothetical protein At1D1460_47240 [Agrobacterium tumefaciens]NSZ35763.1 WD40 repeat domain-containing protein [Agrobacterium tumefaciens]QLG25409.1 WD40 repeat domain-containing protein [Agrobacterium tumefaciens]UXS89282.1 WD40 repeat domain-containing protein [Agrobacterium tumefaciens]
MKHIAPISGVASFQDMYVASAGYDNQVILWDARSHQALAKVNHDHLANMCVFSPVGDLLASASSDYTARIWDVPSMRLRAVLSGHTDDVEMVAFSPDGKRVATCSRDHSIRIFDIDGNHLATCLGHTADVISVAWMPSGTEIVSSSDDGSVRQWTAGDGSQLSVSNFDGIETDTVAITPEGLIFAGDDEGRISILRGETAISSVTAHEAGIKRLVYSPVSRQLVSLSYDRKMKIWQVNAEAIVKLAEAALPNIIWPRSCSFVGKEKIAFATFGSTYAVYNIRNGTWDDIDYEASKSVNAVLPVGDALYTVGDAGIVRKDNAFVADMNGLCNFFTRFGSTLVTGGQMGSIHNAMTGEVVYQHHSPLNCGCAFLRDDIPHAAIGTYTGEVVIIREIDGKVEVVTSIKMHENAIKGVATDGEVIFAVSANRNAAVASIGSFSVIETWIGKHRQIANGCAVVAPGVFCSVSRDLTLRIWRRSEIEEIKTPHRNSSKCVAANETYIATGDYGGRIAVYNLETNTWLNVVRPSTSGISSISTDVRTSSFVASCYDGRVYGVTICDETVSVSVRLDVPYNQLMAAE